MVSKIDVSVHQKNIKMTPTVRAWINENIVQATIIIITKGDTMISNYNKLYPEFYDLYDNTKTMCENVKTVNYVYEIGSDMKDSYDITYTIDDENRVVKSEEIITNYITKEEIRRKIYLLFY